MIGPNCVVKRNGATMPLLVCRTVAAFAVVVSTSHLSGAPGLSGFFQVERPAAA
jgi:hypothetical protein